LIGGCSGLRQLSIKRDQLGPKLQAFYSIRSERLLVERIDHDLLFRWFVGLGIEDPVWDATTFTKNRDRLLEGDIAAQFLAAVLSQEKVKALLSSEHFSVDGTLLEAWASLKSFRPKDGSGEPPGPGRNPGPQPTLSSRRHFPADPKGGIAPPELLDKISPMPVDIKGSGHMHFGAYGEGRRRQSSDHSISSNLTDP
jgi:hypothetical protein